MIFGSQVHTKLARLLAPPANVADAEATRMELADATNDTTIDTPSQGTTRENENYAHLLAAKYLLYF
jgi:hypothetical protein